MDSILRDVRYAVRNLLKAKGFTSVAIITLAVGIGANTAMFSVVNTVLLRPLPFQDPQQLMAVSEFDTREAPFPGPTVSYPDFEDMRSRCRNFQSLAAYEDNSLTMTDGAEAVHVQAETVSASLFGLLGVQPALGRNFLDGEDMAGQYVVMLSDQFWRSHFNASRGVLGKTVNLNGVTVSIVGVMPPGFQFPIRAEAIDLWLTFGREAELQKNTSLTVQRDNHHLEVIGRVKAGISLDQANSELTSIAQALATEYATTNSHTAIAARPELEHLVGDTRAPLLTLFAAVGLVLLIASANVANLLLARSTGRVREIALRLALGATRSRIIRQLVTESLVLSIMGAVVGIGAAYAALAGTLHLYPSNLPRAQEIGIDLRVLLFTTGIAMLSGILFGLAPALQVSKPNLTETMGEGIRSTAGPRQNRLRSGFVIAETALGVMLVIVAGLLLRSFQRLSHSDIGFNPSHLLTAKFNLSETRYNRDQEDRFMTELMVRLRALPGVTAAAGAMPLPLYNDSWTASFDLVDHPVPKENQPNAGFYVVVPHFFEAMQIPLLSGRAFDERDQRNSLPVMIITQAFAKKFFPHEDPIGRRIKVEVGEGPARENYRTREVIGVVGDIRRSNLKIDPAPVYYIPLPQLMWRPPSLVVRTATNPASLTPEIRKTLSSMDPEVALYDVRSMEDCLALDLGLSRFQTVLLSVFAAIALLLTAVGLYGVMAYAVGQRVHEIGVRQAMGATTWDIMWLIMGRGIKLTMVGLGIGVIGALILARFTETLLYQVHSRDPISYLIASVVLAAVGFLASYVPAWRATRVDPLVALRYH